MKPQEAELVSEISKLQCMVSELKSGFSGALLELSQIQHGDSDLREELQENRRSCRKKALRLEALVEALRDELGEMSGQILQLYRQKPLQEDKSATAKNTESGDVCERRTQCVCVCAASCVSRGKLLLHCFLQGLKAGLSEGTDARHQVAMQLLHSEWEYVSTLNQLYDKYRKPPDHLMTLEPYQTYLSFVEQLLQRHLLFRNTLQERLSAEHWKSLIGDILVQLIGQNDTAFSEMYLGYTTTLASFLSLEFNRINLSEETQSAQAEEMKLLSLLLAPVSRIHAYLSHIQSLLQWTGKEHPDCSLLLGAEKALRSLLTRCHQTLQEDVQWEEGGGQSDAEAAGCCRRQAADSSSVQREEGSGLTNGAPCGPSMRVECWSCSPVRRTLPSHPHPDCGHACCSLLTPSPAAWGENSDSGQGTYRQEAPHPHLQDGGETDPDDTSGFSFSSVSSCSPDGTLRGGRLEEEEEEEDSQEPVLLKREGPREREGPRDREVPRERAVCLRWQIPRLTPHPPPCLVSSYGRRVVSVRRGSPPPLHPNSAFRPIWDDPKQQQVDSAPEKDSRGFVPIQTAGRKTFHNPAPSRENIRGGPVQQSGGGLWEDSEDSEGPCSTV
ncbi:uncharacterized protein si:ch211-67f24.7 isoform X1 [Eleginops maclovinus]|uniref:uncharacterized protein si:ch211-67f24.7 isoform X1 n=1 Tax=Eleginops maclovinus TaxID=56733 RepID=UPI0030806E07